LPHFQPENLPQGSWCRNLKHKRIAKQNKYIEKQ
jgi:hypothetical protein